MGVQPTSLPAQSDNIVNDTDINPNNDDSGIDISDIDDSSDLFSETLETANREVGYTPALTTIENNMDKILKSQRNLLSSSAELISDFKDKYTDALNEKIC